MAKPTTPWTFCVIRSLRRSDKARYLAAVHARWSVFRTWLETNCAGLLIYKELRIVGIKRVFLKSTLHLYYAATY